jgi:hypothetical protein
MTLLLLKLTLTPLVVIVATLVARRFGNRWRTWRRPLPPKGVRHVYQDERVR